MRNSTSTVNLALILSAGSCHNRTCEDEVVTNSIAWHKTRMWRHRERRTYNSRSDICLARTCGSVSIPYKEKHSSTIKYKERDRQLPSVAVSGLIGENGKANDTVQEMFCSLRRCSTSSAFVRTSAPYFIAFSPQYLPLSISQNHDKPPSSVPDIQVSRHNF